MPTTGTAGIGMAVDEAIALHGVMGDAGVEIDAGADAALVQVGPAVGVFRRQPQHRHGRLVAVEDHAHVRDALVADGLKGRVQADALLHDAPCRGWPPSEYMPERMSDRCWRIDRAEALAVVAQVSSRPSRPTTTSTPRPAEPRLGLMTKSLRSPSSSRQARAARVGATPRRKPPASARRCRRHRSCMRSLSSTRGNRCADCGRECRPRCGGSSPGCPARATVVPP